MPNRYKAISKCCADSIVTRMLHASYFTTYILSYSRYIYDIFETLGGRHSIGFFVTSGFIFSLIANTLWYDVFNALGPNDTIWRHRSGSTLAQVMAWCQTAPSHYLNQCWLNISVAVWHSAENDFTRNAQDICPWYQFENYWFKTSTTSFRGQGVNVFRL